MGHSSRQDEASAAIQARLTQVLEDAASDNDALIASGRRIVSTWSEVPAVVSGSREECEAAFARLARFAPSVASPTRISADGTVDCGGRTSATVGVSVRDNPLFQTILASDSVTLGPYLPSEGVRDAVVPLNIALRDEAGRVTGVLSIGMRLRWFERFARITDLPAGTTVSVADSSGRMIALTPDGPSVGTKVPGIAERFEADRIAGRTVRGVAYRSSPKGVTRLLAHRQLASSSGTVVRLAIGVLPEVAFAGPHQRRRVRLALLIGSALAALLIAWFGADLFVLRDVNAILGATRRLGAGDLTARTGVARRQGELAQLAQSFDTMASQLEGRQDRLRHAERMESLGKLCKIH